MNVALDHAAEKHRGWFGQPAGLSTLFFTEMWERMSYYGMRALLILYMTEATTAANPGLGISVQSAGTIYGFTRSSSTSWRCRAGSSPTSGWVSTRPSPSAAFSSRPVSFSSWSARSRRSIWGSCALSPKQGPSSPTSAPWSGRSTKRATPVATADSRSSTWASTSARRWPPSFAGRSAKKVGWHWGFGAAGVGMILGLIQYRLGKKRLLPSLQRIEERQRRRRVSQRSPRRGSSSSCVSFHATEWSRMGVIGVLFIFSTMFWGAFEQAGSTLNLFADR